MTKEERQARDRAAVKCWCGNVAGLGQTLCGKHRDEAADPLANIPDPAAFVEAARGLAEEAAFYADTDHKIAAAIQAFRTAIGDTDND